MAHPKHQAVRVRYVFCCGYCGLSETDAGGELTVDHFHPQSHGGDDSDANLVYACFRCNLNKGAFTPTTAQQAQGLRLLHPQQDNIQEHIQANRETGRLEGLTPAGTFHIITLELNRAPLIANRLQRWRQARLAMRLEQAEAELLAQNEILQQYDAYIQVLEEERRRRKDPKNGGE